jgi:perosamine synthetase
MVIAMGQESLAINGGPKVRTTPWTSRHLFGEEEKQAVAALFEKAMEKGDSWLGYNGPQEEAYCREFAEFLGGGFADGVNSGTNALYVALRALELPPYSEVIVPAVTDPGGIMPVPLANLIPVPADCVPGSYNIGVEQIAARLTERTCAIIVAHIAGIPADMDPILELAAAKDLPVIEDCAQAHGATYKGRLVGTFGKVAVFSTMFGKHHATGGQGGVVYTRDENLYWRIRRHADRGKPFGIEEANGNVVAALNCNMDELHATIGRVQLRKLPAIVQRRREIARHVDEGCRRSLQTVRLLTGLPGCEPVYWFLLFYVDLDRLDVPKHRFVQALQAEGIPAGEGYWAVPASFDWWKDRAVFGRSRLPWSSPLYRGNPDQDYPLPNIQATDATHFVVSFHEAWSNQDVLDLLTALQKVEKAYLKERGEV